MMNANQNVASPHSFAEVKNQYLWELDIKKSEWRLLRCAICSRQYNCLDARCDVCGAIRSRNYIVRMTMDEAKAEAKAENDHRATAFYDDLHRLDGVMYFVDVVSKRKSYGKYTKPVDTECCRKRKLFEDDYVTVYSNIDDGNDSESERLACKEPFTHMIDNASKEKLNSNETRSATFVEPPPCTCGKNKDGNCYGDILAKQIIDDDRTIRGHIMRKVNASRKKSKDLEEPYSSYESNSDILSCSMRCEMYYVYGKYIRKSYKEKYPVENCVKYKVRNSLPCTASCYNCHGESDS